MFEIQRGYLDVVRERGFRLPDRYDEFEPQVRRLEQAMRVRPEPTVPCNNDLLAENFIDVGGELRLIDYEYSGNNEACVRARQRLERVEPLARRSSRSSSRRTTARPLREQGRARRLWGLMSKYGWTLWGSIQDGISDLDFDFWGWAMEKYERAVAEFDGPQFERLLADVSGGKTEPAYVSAGSTNSSCSSSLASSSSVPIRTGPLNQWRAEMTHQPPKQRPIPMNQRIV